MTIEIRELIIEARVTEPSQKGTVFTPTGLTVQDEQRLLENVKREVLEYLLERGVL